MRGYRVPLALLVLLLAVVAAFLHPLALALAAMPFDTSPVVAFLERIREAIADLLGWGLLVLLAIMTAYVVAGRLGISRRAAHSPIVVPEPGALRAAPK